MYLNCSSMGQGEVWEVAKVLPWALCFDLMPKEISIKRVESHGR